MSIKLFLQDFLNLFFPDTCEVCGTGLVGSEKIMCSQCNLELPKTRIEDYNSNKTADIFWGRIPFQKAASYFYYQKESPFIELIHKLKYNNKINIGKYIGELYAYELRDNDFFKSIDVIIPVPIHRKRLKERGYNQSEMIALGMQKVCNIPIDKNSIQRIHYTKTQTKKTKQNRFDNVSQIFAVKNHEPLKGKHILIIDDVITTGATIDSLAAEIEKVEGATISIASLSVAN